MLKYKNLFLRPDLLGLSGFSKRECLYVSKLRCKASCLPSCLSSVDLSASKGLHSHIQIGKKVFRDRELSSSVLEVMDNNTNLEEHSNNLHLPTAYNAAMEALSSLITTKRSRDGNRMQTIRKHDKLDRMKMYVKILGLEEQIAGLKIIHVAGTKGKGSTCAFCEAVLRECGFRTGLFTSPHLIDVRERFRLNGLAFKSFSFYARKFGHTVELALKNAFGFLFIIKMTIYSIIFLVVAVEYASHIMDISEEKFLHYFWECWHQLESNLTDGLPMPPLFQFLTVLAFKIFAHEKVDVAIIEVGLGGSRDSTNVINCPVVCGIASLGMDHMETLGDTLGKIAVHKAGIFKPQVPAFTVPQLSEAMDVLQEKAKENKVPLEVVAPLNSAKLQGKRLSLSGDHQFTNAGLAVALCRSWLQSTGNWERLYGHADEENGLPEAFCRGLSTARLSGRAQIVYDCSPTNSSGELIFFLDGAHSPESLDACARWFSRAVKEVTYQSCNNGYVGPAKNELGKITKQILLFNCMDVRDPESLLPALVDTCAASGTYFAKAIFVPSISTYNKVTSSHSTIPLESTSKDLSWQFNLQSVWEKIIHGNDSSCKSIEIQIPEATPPHRFVDDNACNCNPADGDFVCSAVVSSLPMTINWLRNYVKENPSYRIQVLVTGSLHLVGDVLKLLRR